MTACLYGKLNCENYKLFKDKTFVSFGEWIIEDCVCKIFDKIICRNFVYILPNIINFEGKYFCLYNFFLLYLLILECELMYNFNLKYLVLLEKC